MSGQLRFRRGQIFHMTLIERLPSIVAAGHLRCDSAMAELDLPGRSIAHDHLKDRRRQVSVPVPPGGVVGDYVPFYLAPRSPMLAANYYGNVEGRSAGQEGIVYLVTDMDRVAALPGVVIANKHPLRRPEFTSDPARLDDPGFIDWDVMFDPWFTSPTDTERPERRQAEVLVHRQVPLGALLGLAARTVPELEAARAICEPACHGWHFNDRPDWYF